MARNLNAQEILELIPHREPFLFITQAECVSKTEIVGVALWPDNHPIFEGHFPGAPVVPGVCQVEAVAQLAGLLIACEKRLSDSRSPNVMSTSKLGAKLGVLSLIRQASFHAPLLPRQPLDLALSLRNLGAQRYLVTAQGHRADRRVLACELVVAASGDLIY